MNVKKFFLILLIAILCISAALGGVLVAWFTTNPFISGEHGNALAPVGEDGIVNFLLVGRDHVGENTDVIMVLSLNKNAKKTSILSIPRDTRVYVNGYRKINSVYSYAQATGMKKEATLISAVSELTDLPIHYFAIINLRAFREIVDELGGVEFDVKRAYHYDDPYQDLHIHLEPGLQILDGEAAEGLIRYRHDYAMGDIDRVAVQQEFIRAFVGQKLKLKYIPKVSAVYDAVLDDVISNLRVTDIMSFAKDALHCPTSTYLLPGSTNENSPYWIKNDDETRVLIRREFGYTAEN